MRPTLQGVTRGQMYAADRLTYALTTVCLSWTVVARTIRCGRQGTIQATAALFGAPHFRLPKLPTNANSTVLMHTPVLHIVLSYRENDLRPRLRYSRHRSNIPAYRRKTGVTSIIQRAYINFVSRTYLLSFATCLGVLGLGECGKSYTTVGFLFSEYDKPSSAGASSLVDRFQRKGTYHLPHLGHIYFIVFSRWTHQPPLPVFQEF